VVQHHVEQQLLAAGVEPFGEGAQRRLAAKARLDAL
jgi:hypothetical protein